MGLLDDAIREHLDLKRRRGADPAEVEQAERDALGPVRRGPEEQHPDEAGLEQENGHGHVEADEPDWEERWEDVPRADAETHAEPDDVVDDLHPAEPEALAEPPAYAHPAADDPHPAPAPAVPEPEPEPEPEPLAAGEETAEYDVERALEHEREEHKDDVLEETPEFLQDTPDHDRLWFEQKKPRDFDFDG